MCLFSYRINTQIKYYYNLKFYNDFPYHVRRAIETCDSRYLILFDLSDEKIYSYNKDTKKFLN